MMKQWKQIQGSNEAGLVLQVGRMLSQGFTVKLIATNGHEVSYDSVQQFLFREESIDFKKTNKWFYLE